jgi:transcriptional regulator with XRE-family HTH domain
MDYQRDSIGQIVLEARKEHGSYSQIELARKVGVAPVYLCNIEKDRHIPSIEIGEKIAVVLNIDLREFLFLILRSKYPNLSNIFK